MKLRPRRGGYLAKVAASSQSPLYHGTDAVLRPGDVLTPRGGNTYAIDRGDGVFGTEEIAMAYFYAILGPLQSGRFGDPHVYEIDMPGAKPMAGGEWMAPSATIKREVTEQARQALKAEWSSMQGLLSGATDPATRNILEYEFKRRLASVADATLQLPAGLLREPHDTLYPPLWDGLKLRPEAKAALLGRVYDAFSGIDVHEKLSFNIIGSGASYNWDEAGDLDVQIWCSDDALVPVLRKQIQLYNNPTCAELGLGPTAMMEVQFYVKPGYGTDEENLAGRPYACYDINTDRWVLEPWPITPEFYAAAIAHIEAHAEEVAREAGTLIAEFKRAERALAYWRIHDHDPQRAAAELKYRLAYDAVKALFVQVFKGRASAYTEDGHGLLDERDTLVKTLEIWGVWEDLKHIGQTPFETLTKVASSQRYLRFGDLPRGGRSQNAVTGDMEFGVSVYDLGADGMPKDPDPNMNSDNADTYGDMHYRISEWRAGNLPAYVVTGSEAGVGSDNEPIISDVQILGLWDPEAPDHIRAEAKLAYMGGDDMVAGWLRPDGAFIEVESHDHIPGGTRYAFEQGMMRVILRESTETNVPRTADAPRQVAGAVMFEAKHPMTAQQVAKLHELAVEMNAREVSYSILGSDEVRWFDTPGEAQQHIRNLGSIRHTASITFEQSTEDYPGYGKVQRLSIYVPGAGEWTGHYHENKPADLVAFLDYSDYGHEVFIHFMAVRDDHAGRGLARQLVEHLYAMTSKPIDWGKIMDERAGTLWQKFKQTHPDRGNFGKNWYSSKHSAREYETPVHYEVHTVDGDRVRAGSGTGDQPEWDAQMAADERQEAVVLSWGYTDDKTAWKEERIEPRLGRLAGLEGWERYIEHERQQTDVTHTAHLWMPRSAVAHYAEFERSGENLEALDAAIGNIGIRVPLWIKTDGKSALLVEGNHRLALAMRRGWDPLPVRVTMADRIVSNDSTSRGPQPMEPVLGQWVKEHYTQLQLQQREDSHYSKLGALTRKDYEGRVADPDHITCREEGTIPTAAIANLGGVKGEVPGEHRNRQGEAWETWSAEVARDGIQEPIFITVDWLDRPKISEGNHRRDAAVYRGMPEVPVEIRYFGHAERQGTVLERYQRGTIDQIPLRTASYQFAGKTIGKVAMFVPASELVIWWHGERDENWWRDLREGRRPGDGFANLCTDHAPEVYVQKRNEGYNVTATKHANGTDTPCQMCKEVTATAYARTMYHIAHRDKVPQILREGLRTDATGHDYEYVWLFSDLGVARTALARGQWHYGDGVLLAVDVVGLDLISDPHPGWGDIKDHYSFAYAGTIAPERIKVLEAIKGGIIRVAALEANGDEVLLWRGDASWDGSTIGYDDGSVGTWWGTEANAKFYGRSEYEWGGETVVSGAVIAVWFPVNQVWEPGQLTGYKVHEGTVGRVDHVEVAAPDGGWARVDVPLKQVTAKEIDHVDMKVQLTNGVIVNVKRIERDDDGMWIVTTQEERIPSDQIASLDPPKKRRVASTPSALYHGTNQVLAPGDTLRPAMMSGQRNFDETYDYYDPSKIYLTTQPHLAERYARGAVRKAGGEPHVYLVRPIGLCYPDPEGVESGFGTDQWVATMGEVVREVELAAKTAAARFTFQTVELDNDQGAETRAITPNGVVAGLVRWTDDDHDDGSATVYRVWTLPTWRGKEVYTAIAEHLAGKGVTVSSTYPQTVVALRARAAHELPPPPPGTSPLPGGSVRAYHYTARTNTDSIRQNGIRITNASGRSYGEGDGVWLSTNLNDWGHSDSLGDDKVLVEVAIPSSVEPVTGGFSGTFAIAQDVPPSWILAIHEGWHARYRYFIENDMVDQVKAGEFDDLGRMSTEYRRAIEVIKRQAVRSKHGPGDRRSDGGAGGRDPRRDGMGVDAQPRSLQGPPARPSPAWRVAAATKVSVAPAAIADYVTLDATVRRQILAVVKGVQANGLPAGSTEAMKSVPLLRVRSGDYRLFFERVDYGYVLVRVLNRREAYTKRYSAKRGGYLARAEGVAA